MRNREWGLSKCCDVIGTTKRSPGYSPKPMTTAGRTFFRVRSVNGMGNRTTSPREKFIEHVVGPVIPRANQTLLRQTKPSRTLDLLGCVRAPNRHDHPSLRRQWQCLRQPEHPIFVDRLNRGRHTSNLGTFPHADKNSLSHRHSPGRERRLSKGMTARSQTSTYAASNSERKPSKPRVSVASVASCDTPEPCNNASRSNAVIRAEGTVARRIAGASRRRAARRAGRFRGTPPGRCRARRDADRGRRLWDCR